MIVNDGTYCPYCYRDYEDTGTQPFIDSAHAHRFEVALKTAGAIRSDGAVKVDFGASLYILTGITSAYDRIEQHIHPGYIDFEAILHMGLSRGETILAALAGNLYNGGFFDRYTPLDIVSHCDPDGVALATQALAIRKQRLSINDILNR